MGMRYRIPVIQELKQIGFKIEHSTLNEFFLYSKKFTNENRSEVMDLLMPGFDGDVYEERKQYINVLSRMTCVQRCRFI